MTRTLSALLLAALALAPEWALGQARRSIADYAKILKPYIEGAPKSIIDLDAAKVDTLYPDLVIPSDTAAGAKGLFLASPQAMVVMGDSLYICDRLNHCIIVADMRGRLVRAIGRKGQGPGEFVEPVQIAANERYVLVYDHNLRVQVFDHSFHYLSSIPSSYLHLGPKNSLSATREHIFLCADPGDTARVLAYRAEPPFRLVRAFMPRLVPVGGQPLAMNDVTLSASSSGTLCVAYMCLPWIFVFDSRGRQTATIEFRGRPVAKLEEKIDARKYGAPAAALVRRFFALVLALPDNSILADVVPPTKGARHRPVAVLRLRSGGYRLSRLLVLAEMDSFIGLCYSEGNLYAAVWLDGEAGEPGVKRYPVAALGL